MKQASLGLAAAAMLALPGVPANADEPADIILRSPDGSAQITILLADKGLPRFILRRKGVDLVQPSTFGLDIAGVTLGDVVYQPRVERSTVDRTMKMLAGRASMVRDHYTALTLYLDPPKGSMAPDIAIEARAYDDAIAFRYRLKAKEGPKQLTIRNEATAFNFANNFDCWALNLGSFTTSQEGEFDPVKAAAIRPMHLLSLPLLCETGTAAGAFSIAEADVEQYPASYLAGNGNGRTGVTVTLTPRADNDPGARLHTIAAQISLADGGFTTPWRVVMLADKAASFTVSTVIHRLGRAPEPGDMSWIKPGKVAWDWWNGFDVAVPNPGVNTDTYAAYTDFAADMGLDGILIDEGWSVGSSTEDNPNADLTRAVPSLDLPAVIARARNKGLDVWLWAQWQQLDRQMEPALAKFAAWGVKGIKVDFMNRSDQAMIDYYHRLLHMAGKYRIMVNLHGSVVPNGLSRTYPHLLTQEAVLGAEANKWSARITAGHNVTIPFTRMSLGPMDYTPGGFRHVSPAEFAKRQSYRAPVVQTSRGQAVAMYIVYDSPLQMVSDGPGAYRTAGKGWEPGAQFIAGVPASWDESRAVEGRIGEYIVVARRKNNAWYIGGMTNEKARTVLIDASQFGEGSHCLIRIEDAATQHPVDGIEIMMKVSEKSYVKSALMGVSLIALSAGTIQSAMAQEASESQADQQVAETEKEDEIIVSGFRASLEDSLNAKRNSRQISDSITAEDINDFPDQNVVESLARVTGVQIQRDNNGEGDRFQVRGISDVRIEIDGQRQVGGRFDGGVVGSALPSELFGSVEVVKTQAASDTEGGTGGIVRFNTREVLSAKKDFTLAGSAENIYSENADDFGYKASVTLSKNFRDTGIGDFGFVVACTRGRTKGAADTFASGGGYVVDNSLAGDFNGNGIPNEPTTTRPFSTGTVVDDIGDGLIRPAGGVGAQYNTIDRNERSYNINLQWKQGNRFR
jgi:alpha-glucosidase